MSLILDALNKADNERNKEAPPSLSSDHDVIISQSDTNKSHSIVYVLIGAVIVLLGFITYLMARDNTAAPQNVVTAAPLPVQQKQASRPAQAIEPAKPALLGNTAEAERPPEKPVGTYEQMRKKLIEAQYQQAEQTNKPTEQKSDTVNSGEKLQIASIYKNNDTRKPNQRARPQSDPRPNTDKTLSDYPTLSFIGELSHSLQKAIPTLMYREHVHNGNASFVNLNNNKRQKGQLVAENLYLEEILPDGIILRFQSHKFKMKALNSWVNM